MTKSEQEAAESSCTEQGIYFKKFTSRKLKTKTNQPLILTFRNLKLCIVRAARVKKKTKPLCLRNTNTLFPNWLI